MKELLTGSTLYNTVAMVRADSLLTLVVAEGDDDCFVLRDHLQADVQLIAGVGGRIALLEVAKRAIDDRLRDIYFVIDADYDRFLDVDGTYPSNVLSSASHDFFMDLVLGSPQRVDRLITVQCRRAAPSKDNRELTTEIAMKLAEVVGYLRIANERHVLGLRLRDFPFGKLGPSGDTVAQVAQLAADRSSTQLAAHQIADLIVQEQERIPSGTRELVGDHDFFRALARVLQKLHSIKVSDDELFRAFLTLVDCEVLSEVQSYNSTASIPKLLEKNSLRCPCAAQAAP